MFYTQFGLCKVKGVAVKGIQTKDIEGPEGQNRIDDKVTSQCDFWMGPIVKYISYI